MSIWSSLRTIVGFLFRRAQVETEIEQELQAHLRRRADDLERQGFLARKRSARPASSLAGINATKRSAAKRWDHACSVTSSAGFPRNLPAPGSYAYWRTERNSFEGVAADDSRSYTLTGGGEPEQLEVEAVSPELFPLLGVTPCWVACLALLRISPGPIMSS
jgi:hypothetical protein